MIPTDDEVKAAWFDVLRKSTGTETSDHLRGMLVRSFLEHEEQSETVLIPASFNAIGAALKESERAMTRDPLARMIGSTPANDDHLFAMRCKIWHSKEIAVLRLSEIRDDWTRQAVANEANRQYGKRKKDVTT